MGREKSISAERFNFSTSSSCEINDSAPLKWESTVAIFPDRQFFGFKDDRVIKRRHLRSQIDELQVMRRSWITHLLASSDLTYERLVHFWSGYFTTESTKTRSPALLYRQYLLLHECATGNFRKLLRRITIDAAMLQYLDGGRNRKERPNENYAREFLELFTLGEGFYTESDVKTVARALTGWKVKRPHAEVVFDAASHQEAAGRLFGREVYDLDSVIDAVMHVPRLAEHVVERMWTEFVSFHPDKLEVKRLAKVFREADYELRPLWLELMSSGFTIREAQRASLIKSPLELMLGTLRKLSLRASDPSALLDAMSRMGYVWFSPPNVKGWPGGKAWIDGPRLAARQKWLQGAVAAVDEEAFKGISRAELKARLLALRSYQNISGELDFHEFVEAVVLDPVYQLK